MSVSIIYEPDKGFLFDGKLIYWGSKRELVRQALKSEYTTQDQQFENVVSHRDIYNDLLNQPVLLILNYAKDDLLSELEIHSGIELTIFNKRLNLEMLFWDAVNILDTVSYAKRIIDEGEVLFIDLKLSICSGGGMGGEQDDNRLSYIYCAHDVTHLL